MQRPPDDARHRRRRRSRARPATAARAPAAARRAPRARQQRIGRYGLRRLRRSADRCRRARCRHRRRERAEECPPSPTSRPRRPARPAGPRVAWADRPLRPCALGWQTGRAAACRGPRGRAARRRQARTFLAGDQAARVWRGRRSRLRFRMGGSCRCSTASSAIGQTSRTGHPRARILTRSRARNLAFRPKPLEWRRWRRTRSSSTTWSAAARSGGARPCGSSPRCWRTSPRPPRSSSAGATASCAEGGVAEPGDLRADRDRAARPAGGRAAPVRAPDAAHHLRLKGTNHVRDRRLRRGARTRSRS